MAPADALVISCSFENSIVAVRPTALPQPIHLDRRADLRLPHGFLDTPELALYRNAYLEGFKRVLFLFKRFVKVSCESGGFGFMLNDMDYKEKLQRICKSKGMDQAALALKTGLSKSSLSRIMSGPQEPKAKVLYRLAKALDVTLDFLMDEVQDFDPSLQRVMVTEDELTILKLVRRLGSITAIDRLLNVPPLVSEPDKGESVRRPVRDELPHHSPAKGSHEKASGS